MLNQVNFNVIKEIQEKADIVAIISAFVKLTRKGNNYVGLCPFHPDKNPSLVVSPKKKIFKCFVCGAKGNVFGFIQQYKKIPFMDAVQWVANQIGYDTSQLSLQTNNTYLDPKIKRLIDLNNQVNEWYQGFLHNPENQDKLDYLHHRGLTDEILTEFGFGYAPKERNLIYRMASNANEMFGPKRSKDLTWNEKELLDDSLISINQEGMVFDFFSDRITIPIYDNNGYLVAFSGRTISNIEPKYLNTSSTSLFSKGNVLFNFHKAKFEHSDNIIIVEGFMDAIAYVRAGFKNVVATMGVALTNEHLSALRTSTNLNVVILSFDNDNAGNMATVANGQRLMQSGFNTYVVAEYDKDIKDVDELFHKSGKTAIENILNERIDFITFLINNEFINKKTTDEIQKSVVYILKSMIDFGSTSILLRQRHLKLLADKSGLAFEDLRAQFNFDLEKQAKTKKTHKKSYYSKLVKPDNEAGLPETFIEEESVVPSIAETQTKISRYLEDLEDNRKIKQKQLTDGYDSLILAFANSGNALTKYIEEISINSTDFDLGQQKFVLKGIQYLVGKDELLTEENLFNFLEIQSKTTNAIAKDYQKALIYFENLIEAPTYKSYSKRLLAKKQEERIEDIIYHITDVKYHLLIFNKLIKIWKLKKENQAKNDSKIDQLYLEINEIRDAYKLWKELNQKHSKKREK